jgi:hypothetical protein
MSIVINLRMNLIRKLLILILKIHILILSILINNRTSILIISLTFNKILHPSNSNIKDFELK